MSDFKQQICGYIVTMNGRPGEWGDGTFAYGHEATVFRNRRIANRRVQASLRFDAGISGLTFKYAVWRLRPPSR